MTKTFYQVIERVRATMDAVTLGLEALRASAPRRRMAGLRNVLVFGRAITNVLQNLRGVAPDFEEWYGPYEAEMRSDPLMRLFYDLRSRVLKKGELPVSVSITFSGSPADLLRHAGPPPPGAQGFFVGDRIGGSGWDVRLPDGSREQYYVDLPEHIPGVSLEMRLHLSEAPSEYQGHTVQELCTLYVGYLERMVADATQRFREPRNAG